MKVLMDKYLNLANLCQDYGLDNNQYEQVFYDINLYYECTRRLPDSERIIKHIKETKGE